MAKDGLAETLGRNVWKMEAEAVRQFCNSRAAYYGSIGELERDEEKKKYLLAIARRYLQLALECRQLISPLTELGHSLSREGKWLPVEKAQN